MEKEYPLNKRIPKEYSLESEEALGVFLDYVSDQGLELYPAQEEAVLQIFADQHVILNTPTGSGKSLVATATHFKSLSSGKRSFYTCPIKALVNEKFMALCNEFGPESVGMITGDATINAKAPIICCTAEILMNMALREGSHCEVDDVVMDEFHYYSDRDRGVAWQVPLLTLPHCRFVLMSATLGDTEFFKKQLESFTGKACAEIKSSDRPVPLDFHYSEVPLERRIEDLVSTGKSPVYVVNFTQRDCAQNAQASMSLNFSSKEEKKTIASELMSMQFSSPYGKAIKKYLSHGIGIHHAGLLPKYRVLTEKLAQKGLLKIIFGTDTLGVGVNVPIRTVVLNKLCKFNGEKTALLSAREFHQISGRAGRKGFDDSGSVIAQAPAHVIENLKLEAKARSNPKAKKKLVKAKPPEKGYVPWNQKTFDRLVASPPEKLQSSCRIDHSILLNVLSRQQEDGLRACRELLRNCHEPDKSKQRLRRRGFQLLRSLLDRGIIEIIPRGKREKTSVRINADLQEDFSLHQGLSLFLLDTIKQLDPTSEEYSFQILALAEAIVENPKLILLRQLDKIKREAIAEMKAEGMDYEERMDILEKLEHPKPYRDFIYNSFNEFAAKHPWVGEENIKPKGVAREMFENHLSFAEYIREYDLERTEGLLLRYLSEVYKVLVQTVPFDLKNDDVEEMTDYFETIVKSTDSSLVDEWERLKNPTWMTESLEGTHNLRTSKAPHSIDSSNNSPAITK